MTRPVSYYATKYGIPIGLANALIGQESGGNRTARSPKGAFGLTQVMPATARGMGVNPATLSNPDVALDTGFKYLRMQYNTFKRWDLALAAYNAGPNAVRHYGGIPPYAETQHYVETIMDRAGANRTPASPVSPGTPSTPPEPLVALPKLADLDTPDATSAWADRQLERLASGKPYNAVAGLSSLVNSLAAVPATLPVAAAMQAPEIQATGKGSNVQRAVGLVKHALGIPYVWGGSSPSGFDCSGLLQYVWGKAGVKIPRTSQEQWKAGRPVSARQLAVGDAVFFHPSSGGPGHVAFYIGGGKVIAAPHTGTVVKVQRISDIGTPMGYRRFV